MISTIGLGVLLHRRCLQFAQAHTRFTCCKDTSFRMKAVFFMPVLTECDEVKWVVSEDEGFDALLSRCEGLGGRVV